MYNSIAIRWTVLIVLPIGVILYGAGWNSSQDPLPLKSHDNRLEPYRQLFQTADACISCHNGLVSPSGQDVSFGSDWSATMMANSARDPYWHAAVRREVQDHPESQAVIENECSTCHMPMAHYESAYNGKKPDIFSHLPINEGISRLNLLAADGVSCTTCHQITSEKLGSYESFVGRFVIDTTTMMGQRRVFGPYAVDTGRLNIMHSSSGFIQEQSKHIQSSEMCATCHTLITESLGPDGKVVGELPEQVPYLEWKHSRFINEKSCQSCHMPVVKQPVPITSVMGEPRQEVSRHTFQGGNFFMLKMLNRYRSELGVKASPLEMGAAVNRTIEHLQTESATLQLDTVEVTGSELKANLKISNLGGHKLPTAYPSRRAWIYFKVRDAVGKTLFESGALNADGSIKANDNDEDGTRFEPHYDLITNANSVQIYESIMADPQDHITTGLLSAVRFIKDNRLLPAGFDKQTAGKDIAVHGMAFEDQNFQGGSDVVSYRIEIVEGKFPLRIEAELWYQPIAYRWARNLAQYDAGEINRFVGFYDSMSGETAVMLASVSADIPKARSVDREQ